jgi:RNA polymerase sigma factor (sigma-70 family)
MGRNPETPRSTSRPDQATGSLTAAAAQPDPVVELLHRVREGDRAAWDRLVALCTPMLRRIAGRHRLGTADAADAVQNTWLCCLQQLHRIRHPAALRSWLATTCRRECLSLLRHRARCRATDLTAADGRLSQRAAEDVPDPVEWVLAAERVTVLRDAVAALPSRQRAVIRAVFTDQAGSYTDIAAALQLPPGSIGPTRQRAIQRLRQHPRLQLLAPVSPVGQPT